MSQLLIEGVDRQLEQQLQAFAKQNNLSLNTAALMLMRRGVGLDTASVPPINTEPAPDVVGHSLDHLIGTWTEEDEQAFQKTQLIFEVIDETL